MTDRSQSQAWNYVTLDGSTIPVHSPRVSYVKGILWILSAVILFLLGAVSLLILGGVVGGVVGISILSRRILHPQRTSASRKIAEGRVERPRAATCRISSFVRSGWHATGIAESDQFLHPVQYRVSQTVEERLVKHIGTLGPVVAIGRPKERLPLIGAARLYVDDADWQNVVDDLLRRARLVLIQAGESGGLQWELNKAVERLNPEQLLIFLPSQLSVNKPNRQNAYLRFRGWASHYFPLELPETAQDAILIRFLNHPRWQPGLVSRQTVRTR